MDLHAAYDRRSDRPDSRALACDRPSRRRRRGQALVEFAVVSFVLLLIVAGLLTFGFLLFGANIVQEAVDVGAQEFARLPLPAVVEFPELGATGRTSTDPSSATTGSGRPNVFAHPTFKARIFDEQHLVIDLDADLAPGQSVDDYLADKPLINRLLRPVLVYEELSDGRRLVRYPGALVTNSGTGELTVLVPRVAERNAADGRETDVEWHAVVEEIREAGPTPPTTLGPLSLDSQVTGVDPGMVALRINYPFQSGAMVAYRYRRGDGTFAGSPAEALGEDVDNIEVVADDDEGDFGLPSPYELAVAADDVGRSPASGGRFGLGRLQAAGGAVRPYRKLLSVQAVYRREVLE